MTLQPPALDPVRHALLLDFDGTLVRFADDPAAVAVDPPVLLRLLELQAELSGALAIVSGRRIADLDRFLHPLRFAAAGVHGLERRVGPSEPVTMLAGPETLDDVRERLGRWREGFPQLRLEDKGTALVLHYRTHPELKDAVEGAMADAVAGRDDLVVLHGNCIVEVHPAGMEKGEAVRAIMGSAPFAGRIPVYLGDDTTDEYAFRALAGLGGIGVKVGPGDSAASHRLADVAAVHRWLGAGSGEGTTHG